MDVLRKPQNTKPSDYHFCSFVDMKKILQYLRYSNVCDLVIALGMWIFISKELI